MRKNLEMFTPESLVEDRMGLYHVGKKYKQSPQGYQSKVMNEHDNAIRIDLEDSRERSWSSTSQAKEQERFHCQIRDRMREDIVFLEDSNRNLLDELLVSQNSSYILTEELRRCQESNLNILEELEACQTANRVLREELEHIDKNRSKMFKENTQYKKANNLLREDLQLLKTNYQRKRHSLKIIRESAKLLENKLETEDLSVFDKFDDMKKALTNIVSKTDDQEDFTGRSQDTDQESIQSSSEEASWIEGESIHHENHSRSMSGSHDSMTPPMTRLRGTERLVFNQRDSTSPASLRDSASLTSPRDSTSITSSQPGSANRILRSRVPNSHFEDGSQNATPIQNGYNYIRTPKPGSERLPSTNASDADASAEANAETNAEITTEEGRHVLEQNKKIMYEKGKKALVRVYLKPLHTQDTWTL